MSLRVFYLISTLLALSWGLLMCVFWLLNPTLAYELRTEDKFFQDMTVWFYYLSALVAIYFIIRRGLDALYWLIPLFAIFLAGEELSWIEKMTNPPFINGTKIDSLHDFIEVIYRILQSYNFPVLAVSIGIILLAGGAALYYWRKVLAFFKYRQAFLMICLAVVVLAIGQIVDVQEENTHFQKYFFEEVPENVGAVMMINASLLLHFVDWRRSDS